MRLAPAQVDAFFERGFVVLPGVFDRREVAAMRAAFDRLERMACRLEEAGEHAGSVFVLGPRPDRAEGPPAIQRVVWCGAAEPVLSRYGRDPRLLTLAARLLGTATMSQLINQAHFKLPGDGVAFPWHQDSTHRRYGGDEWTDVNGRGSYVQTLTTIDDMTEANGPVRFIPGSGRLGHLDIPRDGTLPEGHIDASAAVTVTAPAGSVVAFGPYVVHSSEPNRSSSPRRAFLNGFACPGANRRTYPGRGAGRLVRAPAEAAREAG